MRKHVVIVHGWKGSPVSNWQPWLKGELEKQGVKVSIPALPNTNEPLQEEWVETLSGVVGRPSKHTFFVTHSLGGMAVLRYLERLPKSKRIGGVVLVAGFSEWNERPESKTFFLAPLNYEKVRGSTVRGIVAIQSENDPFVPFGPNQIILKDRLGARLIVIQNGGHLNVSSDSCYVKLPLVLSTLNSLMC